jgi:hypothetical protein
MAIDEQALLAYLAEKAKIPSLVGGAIYQGLHDRIQRGDFNNDDDERRDT